MGANTRKGSPKMNEPFTRTDGEQSVMELIVDQLEELVVTIIEEIRERPGVAAAILAALLGAIIGSMLAARIGRRQGRPARAVKTRARKVSDAAELAGIGIKLLQNPIVRGYVGSAIEGELKKLFPV